MAGMKLFDTSVNAQRRSHPCFLQQGYPLQQRSCVGRRSLLQPCRAAEPQTEQKKKSSSYPNYEDSKNDTEFLPKRDPGNFPDLAPSRPGWQSAFSNFKEMSAAPTDPFADPADVTYDPLRDGPLRYLGYANEVGEAFAAWLPIWGVPASYAVAIGYVLTDTGDKGIKTYKVAQSALNARTDIPAEVSTSKLINLLAFERTLDTVVWQLLASVACPGYTIHTVVAIVHALLKPLEETPQAQNLAASAAASLHMGSADLVQLVDKSLPTAIGLAVIPFIVHPIDNAIHFLLNVSLRPRMKSLVCRSGGGSLANLAFCDGECCDEGKQG